MKTKSFMDHIMVCASKAKMPKKPKTKSGKMKTPKLKKPMMKSY